MVENKSNLIGTLYIHNDNSIGIDILNEFEIFIPDVLSFLEKRYRPLPYIKA